MSRWDVQVLGLDGEKPAASVVDAVARRLGADASQVERLLSHAPTTLVADLEEAAAKSLVQELRLLGLRVKPRPSGSAATEQSAPPSHMPPPPPEPVTDARATAPTFSLPVVPDSRTSPGDPGFALTTTPPASSRSPLEHLSTGTLSRPSGLELEDVPVPRRSSRPPPSMTHEPRDLPPAPVPREAPPDEGAPHAFWSALPAAFLVPLRGPVLPGLFMAPLFMGVAVLFLVLGMFTAIVGMLVMTAAYVGVTLQVSHRCLWATAVGERMPASLPGGFLAEYAFPGLGVVLVQGVLGGLFAWVSARAAAHGVPMIALQIAGVIFALYSVIGFALAAANRSATGLLDAPRILRILVRAPLEVSAIAIIGGLVQGGAVLIAAGQFAAAVAAGGGIGPALLAVAGSVLVVSAAATYGTALTATMMGMLFWARPEVANG